MREGKVMSGKLVGFLTILVVGLVVLSSCATLSKSECLASDWRAIGVRDGQAGYAASRLSDHSDACSKHGIAPDVARYNDGRTRGLVTYCQLDNAFSEGVAGRVYRNVCPAPRHSAFDVVHQAASQVAAIDSRIRSADSDISDLIDKLSDRSLTAADIQSIRFQINDRNRDLRGYNRERRRTMTFARTILAREKSLLGKTNTVSLGVAR